MELFQTGLERKAASGPLEDIDAETGEISGYASLFGAADQSGDIVEKGAFLAGLKKQMERGFRIKMLWQHDPTRPIGVWNEIQEDERGLFVRGRILSEVTDGKEALALLRAGAVDGLSIGYRTKMAANKSGGRRLREVELWEISLVTFPMLLGARASANVAEAELASQKSTTLSADKLSALCAELKALNQALSPSTKRRIG